MVWKWEPTAEEEGQWGWEEGDPGWLGWVRGGVGAREEGEEQAPGREE